MFGLISCLVLFSVLCFGTLRKPVVAFAAVLCLYGLKQWSQNSSSFFASDRTLMNFAVALLVAVGLLRAWRKNLDPGTVGSVWWLGVALYGYAFITLAWCPDLPDALTQWSLQIPYVLMIAVAAPLLIKTTDDMYLAANWTLWIGGGICVLALIFGKWGLRGLLVNGDFLRSETNPLAIASLGGTLCVIAMVSMMAPMSWTKKTLLAAVALIGIAVILRSGSRGQLIAAVIGALAGMPMAAKKRSIGAWVTMVIVVFIVMQAGWWIWDQLGVDSARWSGKRTSEDAEGRLLMATTLLSAASHDPVKLVIGLGNSSAFHYVGFYPHIALLEIIAEEGIVGCAVYFSMLVLTVRNVIMLDRKARSVGNHDAGRVIAVLAALFIFEWVLTFKQGTLLSSVYVVAYAAIISALHKQLANVADSHALERNRLVPRHEYSNLMT